MRLFTILAGESVDADHPAHDWMVERYRGLRERFVARIEASSARAASRAASTPRALAPQLIAMFDGLQLQWLLDPDAVDLAAVFDGLPRPPAPGDRALSAGRPPAPRRRR